MRTRRAFAIGVSFAFVLFATAAAPSALAKECRAIDGPFTSTLVPPPACTSPIGLCTHGLLTGDFPGTYDFTFQTLFPVSDPAHPGRFFYTGTSVITPTGHHHRHHQHQGTLVSEDHGYLDMNPSGGSPFVTTVMIASGTGHFSDVSGVIVAQGVLDLSTGQAVGSYTGALCESGGDDD
jgi:hypothetical protein